MSNVILMLIYLLCLGWLKTTRRTNAAIAYELETRGTVVSAEDLLDHDTPYDLGREQSRHWIALDDGLSQLPSHLAMSCGYPHLWPKWTYIIDLDRELFSVNFGAHFRLNQIPRAGIWMRACDEDEFGNITIATDICPEECIASPAFVHQPTNIQNSGAQVRFVTPDQIKTNSYHSTHRRLILVSLLRSFSSLFKTHIQRFLLEWQPEDFIFRELAFAILSIASGQIGFESRVRLDGEIEQGFLVKPDKNASMAKSKLLPVFSMGCHWQDEYPGSAPAGTIYWFEEVLVSLTTRLDSPEMVDAAITQTLQAALNQDRREFYALLLSIEHIIILQVRDLGAVPMIKRTGPITLFDIETHLARDPRDRPPQARSESDNQQEQYRENDLSKTISSAESLISSFPGFCLLVDFLDSSTTQSLRPCPPLVEGYFPMEIYRMILDRVDDDYTYNCCAKVSRRFRNYCFQHIRLGTDAVIVDCDDWFKFTIWDRSDDQVKIVSLVEDSHGLSEIYGEWTVTIGSPDRPSFLDRVGVVFHGLVVPTSRSCRKSRKASV